MTNPDVFEIVSECVKIARSRGLNTEFCLAYVYAGEDQMNWSAEIVTPSPDVCLGESFGVYSGDGRSPLEAVERLYQNFMKDRRADDE